MVLKSHFIGKAYHDLAILLQNKSLSEAQKEAGEGLSVAQKAFLTKFSEVLQKDLAEDGRGNIDENSTNTDVVFNYEDVKSLGENFANFVNTKINEGAADSDLQQVFNEWNELRRASAINIQAATRGFLEKGLYKVMRLERECIKLLNEKKGEQEEEFGEDFFENDKEYQDKTASGKIEHLTKIIDSLKRGDAADVIQAALRGYKARKDVVRAGAATTIQATSRGVKVRGVLEREKATTKLQATLRSYKGIKRIIMDGFEMTDDDEYRKMVESWGKDNSMVKEWDKPETRDKRKNNGYNMDRILTIKEALRRSNERKSKQEEEKKKEEVVQVEKRAEESKKKRAEAAAATVIQKAYRKYKEGDGLSKFEEYSKNQEWPKYLTRVEILNEITNKNRGYKQLNKNTGKLEEAKPDYTKNTNSLFYAMRGYSGEVDAKGANSKTKSSLYQNDLIELNQNGTFIAHYEESNYGLQALQNHVDQARQNAIQSKDGGKEMVIARIGQPAMLKDKDGKPELDKNGKPKYNSVEDKYCVITRDGKNVTQTFVKGGEFIDKAQKEAKFKTNRIFLKETALKQVSQEMKDRIDAVEAEIINEKQIAEEKDDAKKAGLIKKRDEAKQKLDKLMEEKYEKVEAIVRSHLRDEFDDKLKKEIEKSNAEIDEQFAYDISKNSGAIRNRLIRDNKFDTKTQRAVAALDMMGEPKGPIGVSILKDPNPYADSYNVKVSFRAPKGDNLFDIAYIAIPGGIGKKSHFHRAVRIAKVDGPVTYYVDGKQKTKVCKAGEIVYDENTALWFNDATGDYDAIKVNGLYSVSNDAIKKVGVDAANLRKNYNKMNIQATSIVEGSLFTGLQIGGGKPTCVDLSRIVGKKSGEEIFSVSEENIPESFKDININELLKKKSERMMTVPFSAEELVAWTKKFDPQEVDAMKLRSIQLKIVKNPEGKMVIESDRSGVPYVYISGTKHAADEYFNKAVSNRIKNVRIVTKESALIEAVKKGDQAAFDKIIKDYDARKKEIEDKIAKTGETMTDEKKAAIHSIYNADISLCDGNKMSALHYAARNGNGEMVEALLARDAKAHYFVGMVGSPLDLVSKENEKEEWYEKLKEASSGVNIIANQQDVSKCYHEFFKDKDGKKYYIQIDIKKDDKGVAVGVVDKGKIFTLDSRGRFSKEMVLSKSDDSKVLTEFDSKKTELDRDNKSEIVVIGENGKEYKLTMEHPSKKVSVIEAVKLSEGRSQGSGLASGGRY